MESKIPDKFLKPYNPKDTESRIYKLWEESGFFRPEAGPPWVDNPAENPNLGKTFSIVLPPPNVTGTLHTGHALMLAIQDIMVRYARMRGFKTLWLPGTVHAAIATEAVVVRQLAKEKTNKHELGREKFLERVNKYAQESHDTIVNQLKKMGASLDWSREAFTLDEKRQEAVATAFKKMHEEGLIYRGERIVNWDPKGQTTVSDDEVDYEPRKAKLYYFKYSPDFPITISTTRPETKLGDTAVAVNPKDKRYKDYVGKTFEINFAGVPLSIKVIADKEVDPEFGTGALGVTPAHSQTDWDIAERHDLPKIQVINEFGKMTVEHADYKDKKTTEAREIIVEKLKSAGLLEKEEEIDQNISVSQRTGAIIEPLPKLQWFVDVNKKIPSRGGKSLKELMISAVEKDGVQILPERFLKVYLHWIENLRDWCISRQIWYGHKIPIEGEEDTLDTWFSSGLWTFSTLGWPHFAETASRDKPGPQNDLANYHPTTVLETGHDILFFWVARMILMSTYLLGEIPFKTVYLHGMVLDKNGKKMSKSNPETAIDPLPTIEKYGADALRMAMIVGNSPGGDISLSEDKIRAYGKFANKIWNVSRFVMENSAQFTVDSAQKKITEEKDKKYLEELDALIAEITKEMDEYKFYLVSEKLYHYFWHTFADKIIEEVKSRLKDESASEEEKKSGLSTIFYLLFTNLKLLHPFMPFITEEIWDTMKLSPNMLMIEKWPEINKGE